MHFREDQSCRKRFCHNLERSGLGELDLSLPPMGPPEPLITSL